MKSWRKLARQLIYAYDKDGGFLFLLPPGCSRHNLDDLQRRCGTNEDCLKSVIEIFLQGRGRYKQPSWRAVLWSLRNASELQIAASIKSYAEPLKGVCTIYIDGHCEVNRFSINHDIISLPHAHAQGVK